MKFNVNHIAKLANLAITPEEEKKFETQLSEILDYIKKLEKVNVEGVEPTNQITGLENVYRDDTSSDSLNQEDVLSQASSTNNGFIKVRGILESV